MKKQNLTKLVKKDGKTFTKDNVEMYAWMCDKVSYAPFGYVEFYGTTSSRNGINDTKTKHIMHFVSACGVDYNTGNDAPRGGASGNFVAVKVTDIKGIIRCITKYCEIKKDGNIILSVTIK